jgi:hypothetical protein
MREKERQSAVTVEYLITTIVALGLGTGLVVLGSTASGAITTAQSSFISLEQKLSLAQDADGNASANGSVQASSQELLTKDSLGDYSWSELKTIASDLSANGEGSVYYAKMTELMQEGSTKTFETDSSVIGARVKVRIIGVCQDVKSDGTGQAGLTFQTTHALATPHEMNASDDNTGGWGSSSMRTWLNDTVYGMLPSDLRSSIVSVEKYYGDTRGSGSSSTASTSDKLFLPSLRELYVYSDDSYPCYTCEGTGPSHDQQYQYYAYEGVTRSNLSLLASMYLDYNGNTPGSYTSWWSRSACYNGYRGFWDVRYNGNYGGSSTDYSYSVVPVFCF